MWRVLTAIALLAVLVSALTASAALLRIDGGGLQAFTLPADIEVPPPPPTDLEAEYHHSLPTVDLTWEELAGDASYNVFRGATAGGPYERIGGSETESYADTDIIEGQTYYYVVTAAGANGLESQPSNEAEVLIAVATPITTNAPQATPTAEPTPVPTPELTLEPTPTSTPQATATPTPEPTAGPEPSPDPTSTPEPTSEPTPTPDVTPTPTPEPTAAPEPSPEPTPTATPEP